VRAASCGLWALGFYPKRYDEKPPQKLAVWIQLQLLAARSRPEAETNSHLMPSDVFFNIYSLSPKVNVVLIYQKSITLIFN
jgi:hypothetical protein